MTYVHSVAGRMRVKCPSLKGNDRLGRAVRHALVAMPGVEEVSFNPRAHCLTVVYDPAVVSSDSVMAELRARGVAAGAIPAGTAPSPAAKTVRAAAPAKAGRSAPMAATAAAALGGAFGRAVFGAVLKTSLERGVATLVTSAIR